MWISQLLVYLPMAGTSQVTRVHILAELYLSLGTQSGGWVGKKARQEFCLRVPLPDRPGPICLQVSFRWKVPGWTVEKAQVFLKNIWGECAHLSYKRTEARK